jgi:hypothetical protein
VALGRGRRAQATGDRGTAAYIYRLRRHGANERRFETIIVAPAGKSVLDRDSGKIYRCPQEALKKFSNKTAPCPLVRSTFRHMSQQAIRFVPPD